MSSDFLSIAVLLNISKSLVPVFFQALGMEIKRYRNVWCALTDYKPAVELIVQSL
jgi:hypothetical protein